MFKLWVLGGGNGNTPFADIYLENLEKIERVITLNKQ